MNADDVLITIAIYSQFFFALLFIAWRTHKDHAQKILVYLDSEDTYFEYPCEMYECHNSLYR